MSVKKFAWTVAPPFRPEDLRIEDRLDIFLAAVLPAQHGLAVSRRALRRLINQGAVYLNRHRVRVAKRRVSAGMWVEIYLDPEVPGARVPMPQLGPEHLLYRDEHLVAVAKPSGLPAQATVDNAVDDLSAQLTRLLAQEGFPVESLSPAHRLDRGTSGVMLLALSRRSAGALGAAFAERRVEKVYHAMGWLEGPLAPEVEAGSWVRRDRLEVRKEMGKAKVWRVSEGGRRAETRLRILEVRNGLVHFQAWPTTGRMHQVRVHAAASGLPVVGDRLYGLATEPQRPAVAGHPQRLMLHAAGLRLAHPITGQPLQLDCPLPEEMKAFFRAAPAVS
jgi:RluA family pseudouridine synthase